MGPWLCSHGREGGDWLVTAAFRLQWGRGFAATEGQRVRRLPLHESLLQWGRGFAATEGRRYARLPRWQRRFNGAVALQPRKDGPHASRPAGADASMGPWLCSHGRAPGGSDATRRIQSFNGAVALQPRKAQVRGRTVSHWLEASMGPWLCSHGRVRWGRRARSWPGCFNGAVALQPRKAFACHPACGCTSGFNGAVALQPRKEGGER